jgi:hypothetical protein
MSSGVTFSLQRYKFTVDSFFLMMSRSEIEQLA